MANNGVVITSPEKVTADVAALLELSNYNIGYLCGNAHGKTNIFARFKPVRLAIGNRGITLAERKTVAYGIALGYIASATSAAVNLTSNLQASLPTIPKWGYNAPRPGTDPCRIGDFINTENPTSPGYNKAAKPPISGLSDITVTQTEFGSESKILPMNMKWGESSQQGSGDTSGIEIPLNELHATVTDGTWRLALLIFFPSSGKYQVAVASSPAAITASPSQPGDMMIRPAGTGQLKQLLTTAFNAGTRELDAIPVIASGLSRGGSGTSDRWMFQASSLVISMPLGEKIKLKLSSRFANVTLTFNSIIIRYLDSAGTTKVTYTLYPVGGSGLTTTQLAAPSASGSVRCQIVLDFTISGTMASGDSVANTAIKAGIGGILVGGSASPLERYLNNTWSTIASITSLSGRYRVTVTDGASSVRTSLMNAIESLPRRTSGVTDNYQYPTVSLGDIKFNASNYFSHKG